MSRLAETIIDLRLKDDLEAAIDDALHASGGDPQVTIGALTAGQRSLIEAYAQRISAGYVRRGAQ